MRISKEQKKEIFKKFLESNKLSNGLGSRIKFEAFLISVKEYENAIVSAFENSGTHISDEQNEGINANEVYKIIIEIFGAYGKKGLDDFLQSSPNNKIHEMIDGFCNQYQAKIFKNQNNYELSPIERAYYASKLNVKYKDMMYNSFKEERKDHFLTTLYRSYKDLNSETIDRFLAENVDYIFDLDVFSRFIYKNIDNGGTFKEAVLNENHPYHGAARLQALKTISTFFSEDELKYFQENNKYLPQTIAKIKLGLVPNLIETIHSGKLNERENETVKALIANSEELSKSWGMDDVVKYLNVIWNYKDLVSKFNSEKCKDDRIALEQRIISIINMPVEQIVSNCEQIREEIEDIALSVEVLQREDLVEHLDILHIDEKPYTVKMDDGEEFQLNATLVNDAKNVGVFMASFFQTDMVNSLDNKDKNRLIKENTLEPFTEDTPFPQEYHFCTTAFTANVVANGGEKRGRAFFIYDRQKLNPEDIIISLEAHEVTKNDLYDLYSIRTPRITSSIGESIKSQKEYVPLFKSYLETETDISITSEPSAMGILYSKSKGKNDYKDTWENLVKYAKSKHLPIVIYDMDEINNQLEASKDNNHKKTKGLESER